MTDPIVSTAWLADRLGDPDVRVVDVRWSLVERDKGRDAYRAAHVPGAVFLDVDRDLASPRGQGPGRHPLPTPEAFAATMSRAGIGAGTHVVAYDFGDGSTAARAWWPLRHFGHDRVSVLDGGFARWQAEGRPTDSAAPAHPAAAFVATPRPAMRIDPVAGHVPGAVSRPYAANVRVVDDPRLLEPARLREGFTALGAERATTIACYCGSGINACQNLLALEVAGLPGGRLYEGSWSDWCSEATRPVKTGAEP